MAVEYPHPDSMYSNLKDETKKYESPYSPEAAELESIASIRKTLEKGYSSKEPAKGHFTYLEGLRNKYLGILSAERDYGIVNEQLPRHLQEINLLMTRVKEAIERLS